MRLSRASDFALRILMLLAQEEEAMSVSDIAPRLGLAKSHTMKIVAKLGGEGVLETQRGRGGGVQLALPPGEISIGRIVRAFESDFAVVDCLNSDGRVADCCFLPKCALKPVIARATRAFLASLDETSLASVVKGTQAPRTRVSAH